MSSDTDPFSDGVLGKAVEALANLPPDQVQGGVTYDETLGVRAEVEGQKGLGHGWFVAADATYSQRLKAAAALVFGWKAKP